MYNWNEYNNLRGRRKPGRKPGGKPAGIPGLTGNPEPHQPESGPWAREHFPAVYTALTAALDQHPAAQSAIRQALRRVYDELHPTR